MNRITHIPSPVPLLLTIFVTACSTPTRPETLMVWPSPPAQPRIKLVQIITTGDDFARPGLFDQIGRAIAGSKQQGLIRPQGISADHERYLYVTDQELQGLHIIDRRTGKHRFISRVDQTHFVSPVAVVLCGDELAVSDSALNKVFILSLDGKFLRTIEKPGGFARPTGLAYDSKSQLLYVVDTLDNEVCAFNLAGELQNRFGSHGVDIGQFNYPTQIFVGPQGHLYVTDSLNFRVQVFTPDGQYVFDIGKLGDASGYMAVPKGVGVDSSGHIYVIDTYFSAVQVFSRNGQFLLSFGTPGEGLGQLKLPTGLTVDRADRIYVCDSYNSRVQVFQYVGSPYDETSPANP